MKKQLNDIKSKIYRTFNNFKDTEKLKFLQYL